MYRVMMNICIALSLLVLVVPSFAQAYIDPGAGSYAFQVVVASVLGVIYTFRSHFQIWLRKLRGQAPAPEATVAKKSDKVDVH